MLIGANCHVDWAEQKDPAVRADIRAKLKAMGVTSVRVDYSWISIQPDNATQWNFDELDTYMDEFTEDGLSVLLMLYQTPGWAAVGGQGGKPAVPADPADFGRLCGTVAARYGEADLAGVEFWNEPDLDGFWAGTPQEFSALLAGAYPVAKQLAPDTIFLAAAPTYLGLASGWFEDMYADNRYRPGVSYDVQAIHPYPSPSDLPPNAPASDWSINGIPELQALRAEHADTSPLWVTEVGWSTHDSPDDAENWKRGVSEAEQAAYTLGALILLQGYDIAATYLYTDRDMEQTSDPHERNFGLLRTDNSPKPVADLLAAVHNATPEPPDPPDPTPEPEPDQGTTAALVNALGHPLDTFPGASDDERLTAAMSYAAAQSFPPPILLGAREHTFTTQRALYDGFTLLGVPGMGNAEIGNQGAQRTRVRTPGGGVWLTAAGGVRSGSQNWDVAIRNLAFVGSSSTQWMGGGAVLWCANLRDCSWSGYKSILGSQATKLLLNLCLLDGWLSFHNSYSGGIHIGGSDNALFMGMTNIDSGTAFNAEGGANGQHHLWLDYLEKTTIGPIYLTAEGGWNGIRVTGPDLNAGGSNLGGPLWITGAKIEGRNTGAPCNGSLIRVDGGELHLRDTWLGYAMADPAATGHNPQDAGVVHQTAGSLLLDGVTYDRANGVPETVPLIHSSGGEVQVSHVSRGSKGGAWSGRPRVTGCNVFADATVTRA